MLYNKIGCNISEVSVDTVLLNVQYLLVVEQCSTPSATPSAYHSIVGIERFQQM